jgi:hypothetical protein
MFAAVFSNCRIETIVIYFLSREKSFVKHSAKLRLAEMGQVVESGGGGYKTWFLVYLSTHNRPWPILKYNPPSICLEQLMAPILKKASNP